MNSLSGLRFLRPYLYQDLIPAKKSVYLRFFNTTQCINNKYRPRGVKNVYQYGQTQQELRGAVNERVEELKDADALKWPRVKSDSHVVTCAEFHERYKDMTKGDLLENEHVLIRGRVRSFRVAGKALVFMDVHQDGSTVQVTLNLRKLGTLSGVSEQHFKAFYHLIRRGDIVSAYGHPSVTTSGERSISAVELPDILSPSLANLPRTLEDRETRIRSRHVDLLVNQNSSDTFRARSHIIQNMRNFFLKDNFLEVQTPLLSEHASGAVARPFTTVATEFSEKQLALRIAPEIWLKRLIIGGLDRVFEIGPSFRNEGLDATHNPEFTTCEFYKSFASLEELMTLTEKLLASIASEVKELRHPLRLKTLPEPDEALFNPFKRIAFIPAIEAALDQKLPNLAFSDAQKNLIALFNSHFIPIPSSPTLPRLLDRLASIYIEPSCTSPTFITHHPSCMAPLAKSFRDPITQQIVSARAELFIRNHEIANMYEEENSPFEQREKFLEQAKWRDDENKAYVDESYLEALEHGLPPTGGWGCGVDRLVMLFTGAKRISDVLAFGSLRNVVNLHSVNPTEKAAGSAEAKKGASEEKDM